MSDSIKKYMEITEGERRAMAIAQNGNEGLHYEQDDTLPKKRTPKHYDNGLSYDVIDVCTDFNLNFNRGNVVKYICRASHKGAELQDLKKCRDYIEREIETLTKKLQIKG
jgi:hypothetical protein